MTLALINRHHPPSSLKSQQSLLLYTITLQTKSASSPQCVNSPALANHKSPVSNRTSFFPIFSLPLSTAYVRGSRCDVSGMGWMVGGARKRHRTLQPPGKYIGASLKDGWKVIPSVHILMNISARRTTGAQIYSIGFSYAVTECTVRKKHARGKKKKSPGINLAQLQPIP